MASRQYIHQVTPTKDPGSSSLVRWASDLAAEHLLPIGDRWKHTAAVASRAVSALPVVMPQDQTLLLSAAWLHDLGYAPEVARTGFHPLDGARFLEQLRAPKRVVNLVANHSCARFEAWERDLLPELAPYELEVGPVADALIFADMTTGPTGESVSVEDRLSEILRRYSEEDPVHRAIAEASTEIKAAVSRVEQRLAELL